MLINEDRYKSRFSRLERERDVQFFCINDGPQSARNQRYQQRKQRVLSKLFPNPAPWERVDEEEEGKQPV